MSFHHFNLRHPVGKDKSDFTRWAYCLWILNQINLSIQQQLTCTESLSAGIIMIYTYLYFLFLIAALDTYFFIIYNNVRSAKKNFLSFRVFSRDVLDCKEVQRVLFEFPYSGVKSCSCTLMIFFPIVNHDVKLSQILHTKGSFQKNLSFETISMFSKSISWISRLSWFFLRQIRFKVF